MLLSLWRSSVLFSFASCAAISLAACRWDYELLGDDLGSDGVGGLAGSGPGNGGTSGTGGTSDSGSGNAGSGGANGGASNTGSASAGGASSGGTGGSTGGSGGTGGITGGGSSPVASFVLSRTAGDLTSTFSADASASSDEKDPQGSLTFEWDWLGSGDFVTGGVNANYVFPSPGDYSVALRVTDTDMNTVTTSIDVRVVANGSLLTVSTPADEEDVGAAWDSPGGTGLSLREAILIATSSPGFQVIWFQPGVFSNLDRSLPQVYEAMDFIGDGTNGINGTGLPNNRTCLMIQGSNVRVMNLEIYGCSRNGLQVQNGNDVIISGNVIHDVGVYGIFTASSGGHLIVDNEFYATGDSSIQLNSGGVQVVDNYFHDNLGVAVELVGGSANSTVRGNLIVGGPGGISVNETGQKIHHNTIVGSWGVGITVSSSGTDVRNNIIANHSSYAFSGAAGDFSQLDFNLAYGNLATCGGGCTAGPNSSTSNPLFVGGGDYRLQAGSPAVDQGTDLGYDVNGAAGGNYNGPAPDLGYDEAR